jgi:hypothetical protein
MLAKELSTQAPQIWRETTRTPLRNVTGAFAAEVAFYSRERTAILQAPQRCDVLAICYKGDLGCRFKVQALNKTVRIETANFNLLILPPCR